jgi:hypothetical protein
MKGGRMSFFEHRIVADATAYNKLLGITHTLEEAEITLDGENYSRIYADYNEAHMAYEYVVDAVTEWEARHSDDDVTVKYRNIRVQSREISYWRDEDDC